MYIIYSIFVFITAWSLVRVVTVVTLTVDCGAAISVNVVLTDCYHDQPLLTHLIFSVANTRQGQTFPNTLLLCGVWRS